MGKIVECYLYYRVRHIHNSKAISYPEHLLRSELGRNWKEWTGHVIRTEGNYRFNSTTSMTTHSAWTKQLTVSPEVVNAVKRQKQLARQRKVPFTTAKANAKSMIKHHNALKHGRKAKGYRSKAKLPSMISVNATNIDMLDTVYIDWLETGGNPTLAVDVYRELFSGGEHQKLEAWQRDTEIMLQLIRAGRGLFPQEYEHRNNKPRYQGVGLSLQNCHKILRNAALAGMNYYDINCCHHVIVQHYAALAGIECPTVDWMVADKGSFRQSISDSTGIPVDDVKTALLMVVYGANFQWFEPYDDDDKVSLLQLLGDEGHSVLQDDPTFKALHSELKRVFRFIVKHHKAIQRGWGYKNAMGQVLKTSDKPKQSQIVAFILQGIEAKAAQAMIEVSETARVLIHDGIVTEGCENIPALEQAMLDATGISFTLHHEVIEKPDFLP